MTNYQKFLRLFLLSIIGVSLAAAQEAVVVHDAWINAAPPGVEVTAGYFMIHNNGAADISLEQVTSPDFGRVEMHRTIVSDGIARMEPQASIRIPARAALTFKPGDYHLMLFQPRRKLAVGDTVSLTVSFSDAVAIEITAAVRQPATGESDHSQHH
jgi:hypothetical protein